MKKILGALLAGALAFGLMGCPTPNNATTPDTPETPDTPDTPDTPTTFDGGYWFYYEMDVSDPKLADAEDVGLIFKSSLYACQTEDVKGVAKTGAVYYEWNDAGDGTKATAYVSKRTDAPAKNIGNDTDKLGVYVYTNVKSVELWAFGGADWKIAAEWGDAPAMTSDAEIVIDKVKATLKFRLVNGAAETEYWINGTPWGWKNGWPYAGWGGDATFATDEDHAAYRATSDTEGTASWATPVVIDVVKSAETTGNAVKVVDIINAELAEGNPTFSRDDGLFTIPAIKSNATFIVTIDAKEVVTDGDKERYKVTIEREITQ